MNDNQSNGYSSIQIALHWGIAALVAFQLLFGEGMTNVRDAPEEGTVPSGVDLGVSVAHYWVGLAILALVLIRIGIRFTRGVPPRQAGTLMDWVATLVHWAFYAMLFAMPILGLLTVYVSDALGDIHKLGKPVFVVLIAMHVLGALFHQFIKKDGALRRILVPVR